MSRNEEYECAISGTVADAALESTKDGLAGLPPGWTKLTVEHREVNPKWMAIRDLKSAMIENIVKNFPEEQRVIQRFAVELQIEAQYAALEESTPIYQTSKEIVYLAPRETAPGIKKVIDDLREQLGLESLAYDGEEDDAADIESDAAGADAQAAAKKKKT